VLNGISMEEEGVKVFSRERGNDGGMNRKCLWASGKEKDSFLFLFFVLVSLESGYLEKGNNDWQSVSFSEASGEISDSP